MIKRILLSLALVCSSVAGGQSVTQLPRITPTTGLADSSLFLCADSSKTVTRACKFSLIQSRLSFKAFDSLLTTKLNLTSGTITGSPTWSSTFVAAAGQRVDSATGAARASGLVGNPAITVSSCTGCGGGTPQDSIRLKNGAAATPSLMFANSLTSGLYRFGADTIGIATAGVHSLQVSGGAAVSIVGGAGNMKIVAGTGVSRDLTLYTTSVASAQVLGLTISSACSGGSSCIAANMNFRANGGGAAAPGLSFANAPTNGLWSSGNDSIYFANSGVRSLTVANGATTSLIGGAGNMTIQAGMGASRRLTLQTTTSGSTATTFLRGNELQQSVFIDGTTANPGISFSGDTTTGLVRSGAGLPSALSIFVHGSRKATFVDNAADTLVRLFIMPIDVSNGTRLTLFDTTHANNPKARIDFSESGGAPKWTIATNVALGDSSLEFNYSSVSTSKMKPSGSWYVPAGSAALPSYSFIGDTLLGVYRIGTAGASDTLMIAANGINQMKIAPAGILRLPLLPAEGATKNAMCWDGTTFNVTQNAAATCTVSSARFKENIVPVDAAAAWKIVGKSQLHSSTYNERVGGRKAIGIIAEQADSADTRLASRDAKGIITSTNYEEVTSLLLTIVKDQKRQLDSIKTILKAHKP